MPSNTAPKTILLRGEPVGNELIAAGVITPGMLVERTSAGLVQANGTAADTAAAKLVAREMELTDGDIDTDYAADDQTLFWSARSGDQFYMFLEDEGNVAIGAMLESDGAGALQAVTTGTPLFMALEAVNNTGGSGPVRIKVEAV